MEEPFAGSNIGPAPIKAARTKAVPKGRQLESAEAHRAADTVKLFAAALGDLSDTMAAIAADSVRFASVSGSELVVDVAAVVAAMLVSQRRGRIATAAVWLQEWSVDTGLEFSTPEADLPNTPAQVVLSFTLRSAVMPRATELRDRTMGATPEPVGVRHLLFALAEQPPAKWPPLAAGAGISADQLQVLRALIVARTGLTPLKGEDMAAWQQVLTATVPAPQPPPAERTPLLSDSPAAVDDLGRKPLAEALAARLVRLQRGEAASGDPRAVMVHLHGPWGSGKSSFVNFLGDALARENPRWLVVEFNAWRNARVKPPWWNMLTELNRGLSRRLIRDVMPLRWAWLQLRWGWISPSVDNIVLVAAGFLLAAVLLAGGQIDSALATLKLTGSGEWVKSLKDLPTQLTLITGVLAAVVAGMRGLLLGGKHVAASFDALRTDSFRPFIGLFDMLVRAAPCPVLIVLDDLDRCDQATVTDLLEGIQTLFRGAPVVFLAVADRHWITASFGERFKLFGAAGDQARPVGDLFLDKMFQVSVSIPALPVAVKRVYLGKLLGADAPAPAAPLRLPATAVRHEEIQAFIDAADEDQRPALRAEAVERASTAQADRIVEHRLMRWAHHVEPNPRGMKRLVNAIGMGQARAWLEGRSVEFDVIVLWTILELRWPRAAAAIIAEPGLIDREGEGPDPLKAAWDDPVFQKLAGELDAVQVRALHGSTDEDDPA